MKIRIDIDSEERIIRKSLKRLLTNWEGNLKSAEEGVVYGVYSRDRKEEIKFLKRDIKALKTVLKLYTP